MCKKLCFLMSFVLVLGLVGSARADSLPAPWAEQTIGGGYPGSSAYDLETESVAVTGTGSTSTTPPTLPSTPSRT